jgi:hypothetical protein
MMGRFKAIALVIGVGALLASPAFASNGHREDGERGEHHSVGVPGPIAGAGLPFVVVAGVYLWRRRASQRAKDAKAIS